MQIRVTLVVDYELTEQEAFDRYQTVDPYEVANAMRQSADDLPAKLKREAGVVQSAVKAEPLPWTVRTEVEIDGHTYLEGPDGHWHRRE